MAAKSKPAPVGRYDLRGAWRPDNLGAPPPSLNARTAVAAVRDPKPNEYGPKTERIQVTVRVDLLERELAHGWIDDAAYLAGRTLERALERGRHIKAQSAWGTAGRVDNGGEKDAVGRALEIAQSVAETKQRVVDVVGEAGLRFLVRFLTDGWTFSDYADRTGKGGKHGTAAVADRFRWMLRELAEAWGAKGNERGRIRAERSE